MTVKGISDVNISGVKETYKGLGLLEEEIIKAAVKGLKITAQNIAGEADKLAPRDTGTLARSICVTVGGLPVNPDEIYEAAKAEEPIKPKAYNKNNLVVTVSANTPYARRQHEEHSSKAKYLERPFNEKKDEILYNIQLEAEKVFKRKITKG